jgi:hypothetical protein
MRIKIRKPTIKKYPKRPKGTSLKTVVNYLEKVKRIDKENLAKIAEYNKAITTAESVVKKLGKLGKATDVLAKLKTR